MDSLTMQDFDNVVQKIKIYSHKSSSSSALTFLSVALESKERPEQD